MGPVLSGPAAGPPGVVLNIGACGGVHLLVPGTARGQHMQELYPRGSKEGFGSTDTSYATLLTSKGREQPPVHFIYWCRCNPRLQW